MSASPEQVWKLLIDAEVLKRCTPGCERLDATNEHAYEAVLNVGVGAVKGRYTGRLRLEELQPPSHLKLVVEGKGTQGFMRATGTLELSPGEGGTAVAYSGDVRLGGPIASVGQRMLQSSAKMMAGQFFSAIEAEVAAIARAEASGRAVVPPKHGPLRNLFRFVWSWVKRVFAR